MRDAASSCLEISGTVVSCECHAEVERVVIFNGSGDR